MGHWVCLGYEWGGCFSSSKNWSSRKGGEDSEILEGVKDQGHIPKNSLESRDSEGSGFPWLAAIQLTAETDVLTESVSLSFLLPCTFGTFFLPLAEFLRTSL